MSEFVCARDLLENSTRPNPSTLQHLVPRISRGLSSDIDTHIALSNLPDIFVTGHISQIMLALENSRKVSFERLEINVWRQWHIWCSYLAATCSDPAALAVSLTVYSVFAFCSRDTLSYPPP